MNDLIYKASYSFVITIPLCKVGKEGVHQLLIEIIKRQEKNCFLHRWNSWSLIDEGLVCRYEGEPFGNLHFKDEIIITDDTISCRYEECTDQQVMLPNIQSFVYMMLFAVKTAEQLQNGFDIHAANCMVELENNADVYFYEKYSPLPVDYSRLLKYGIPHKLDFGINVESHDDVFVLFNRFYQQYKSEGSVAKPYISLIKELFEHTYDAI